MLVGWLPGLRQRNMPAPIQVTSNSTTGSSLTLTFGSNIGAGHSVIVCVGGISAISAAGLSVFPGTGGDTYTQAVGDTTEDLASIWYVLSSGGGYATINIHTTGNPGLIAYAYEVNKLTSLDKTSSSGGGGSSWSSGTTSSQSTSSDFAVGIGSVVDSASSSITGPSSGGWTNETAINNVSEDSGSFFGSTVSGYQFLSTNSGIVYSGTGSGTGGSGLFGSACVATFQFASSVTVNLPVAQVNVKAPAPQPPVLLPRAQVTIAALPPAVLNAVNLAVARVAVAALAPKIDIPPQLLIALASQAGTDGFANSFPQGILAKAGVIEGPEIIVGSAPNTQIELNSVGNVGTILFVFNNAAFSNAEVVGHILGSVAQVFQNGPKNNTVGFGDFVGEVYNSSDGVSSSANLAFEYTDDSGTARLYALMDASGFRIQACPLLVATEPGTGTITTPATNEIWHSASLINSWSGSGGGVNGLFYRILPFGDGLVEIIADIVNATATGNSICFTLPSGYRPAHAQNQPAGWNNPVASNSATVPWVFVNTNGDIQITAIEVANKGIFFHIFVPLTLVI